MKVKIIEKGDRSSLCEGVTSGMGFAFAKKTETDTYETVSPISTCKDFLNEVVYTEATGFSSRAYGMNWDKKVDLFKDRVYLVIKMLARKGGSGYSYANSTLEKDTALLCNNYKNMQAFMRCFDEILGLKPTKIAQSENGMFLVTLDKEWVSTTYSISLYTLLIRAALVYEDGDFLKFLDNYKYSNYDAGLLRSSRKGINKIIETKELPTYSQQELETKRCPHNEGILRWCSKLK